MRTLLLLSAKATTQEDRECRSHFKQARKRHAVCKHASMSRAKQNPGVRLTHHSLDDASRQGGAQVPGAGWRHRQGVGHALPRQRRQHQPADVVTHVAVTLGTHKRTSRSSLGDITITTCLTQQCDTHASPTGFQSEWRLPKQNRLAKLSTEYQYRLTTVVSQPQPLLGFLAKLRHVRDANDKHQKTSTVTHR
jgi:hypothetical protein